VATAHASAQSAVDVEQVIWVRIRVCLSVSIYGGHRSRERAVCCGCGASHTGEEMCVYVCVCVCVCLSVSIIVATAHVSAQSAVDVEQVIQVRRCVCV